MSQNQKKIQGAVRRNQAESYLLTSLVAFAATVIVTRVFLELSGYPQIGNEVLHIAHALWGGLLLFVAALLPLALANHWAIQASALLGGVGTGLFIDEVGKFITQANDYFFPPSLSIVYAFFLLTVFVYLAFRRPQRQDPRKAMYRVLERLQDALDGDLDVDGAAQIEAELTIAKTCPGVMPIALRMPMTLSFSCIASSEVLNTLIRAMPINTADRAKTASCR